MGGLFFWSYIVGLTVYNTLYSQREYLNNIDPNVQLPISEYLTKLIHLNYLPLVNNNSCILFGLNIEIMNFIPGKLDFDLTIHSGMGIHDLKLFELLSPVTVNCYLNKDLAHNAVAIAIRIENEELKIHTINCYIDKENHVYGINDLNEFIIGFVKASHYDNSITSASPNFFVPDLISPDLFYYSDLNSSFPIIEITSTNVFHNLTVLGQKQYTIINDDEEFVSKVIPYFSKPFNHLASLVNLLLSESELDNLDLPLHLTNRWS